MNENEKSKLVKTQITFSENEKTKKNKAEKRWKQKKGLCILRRDCISGTLRYVTGVLNHIDCALSYNSGVFIHASSTMLVLCPSVTLL